MSSEPNRPSAEMPPDPPGETPRPRIEKIEAGLILALLLVIVAGTVYNRLLPKGKSHTLSVKQAEENHGLPGVDWSATPAPMRLPPKDLNQASRADLIALPGIGPTLADQILLYREKGGGFKSFEELDEVPGIGPKKLGSLREYLFVQAAANPASATAPAQVSAATQSATLPVTATPAPSPAPTSENSSRFSLNVATREQLESIPGIGKSFAERILSRRTTLGRFHSWQEVGDVPGIGEKRLENLQRYATID